MRFLRVRAVGMAALLASGYMSVGCDKAKSALEEALGFKLLEQSDVDQIKQSVNWKDDDKNLVNLQIVKGVELTDKFPGDLSKSVKLGPLPGDLIPDQGKTAAGNQKSLILARVVDLKVDDHTSYKRLQIITVARFDPESNNLVIDGDKINQRMDPDQIVGKGEGQKSQAGQYLFIQGRGDKGLQFLGGTIKLKRDGQTDDKAEATKNAWVFTTASPFVTETGSGGQYLLAIAEGSKGSIVAYKGDIKDKGSENPVGVAPGTPTNASKDVSYAGLLDPYKGTYDGYESTIADKTSSLGGGDIKTKGDALFTKANNAVTNFTDSWKIIVSDLMFVQPHQAPPAAPVPPAGQPQPATKPAVPAAPAANDTVMRRDPNDTDPAHAVYNVDLGCSGYKDDGTAIDLVRDGAKMDDYTAAQGWRATGDVRYAYDLAATIFPQPTGDNGRYLDGSAAGYCLLTTGDILYQQSGQDGSYLPTDDGMTSQMWQKVQVPGNAKSIQVRVAFFSTEFPKFVGSPYNDSFFVKFDESPDVIAAGNLNELAGGKDWANDASVKACSGLDGSDLTKTCGDWSFVAGVSGMNGELWGIDSSTTAPKAWADKFHCGATQDASADGRCFSGMIKPRIVCKDLTAQDKGQLRTLRFNVSDAGDPFFDSALAVDSVAFSTGTCADANSRMTTEPDSRASLL